MCLRQIYEYYVDILETEADRQTDRQTGHLVVYSAPFLCHLLGIISSIFCLSNFYIPQYTWWLVLAEGKIEQRECGRVWDRGTPARSLVVIV